MKVKYGQGQKGFSYQAEEDAFLLVMMHRHGYGAARRIQLEIRRAWQFRFNWFFKSRNPQEIQKRCDVLIRAVERELEETREKEAKEEEEKHQKSVEEAAQKEAETAMPMEVDAAEQTEILPKRVDAELKPVGYSIASAL
jgi:SWI/SNF-related matrix-associated actin-dependent regulator of chromatin subfamily A member 5